MGTFEFAIDSGPRLTALAVSAALKDGDELFLAFRDQTSGGDVTGRYLFIRRSRCAVVRINKATTLSPSPHYNCRSAPAKPAAGPDPCGRDEMPNAATLTSQDCLRAAATTPTFPGLHAPSLHVDAAHGDPDRAPHGRGQDGRPRDRPGSRRPRRERVVATGTPEQVAGCAPLTRAFLRPHLRRPGRGLAEASAV